MFGLQNDGVRNAVDGRLRITINLSKFADALLQGSIFPKDTVHVVAIGIQNHRGSVKCPTNGSKSSKMHSTQLGHTQEAPPSSTGSNFYGVTAGSDK